MGKMISLDTGHPDFIWVQEKYDTLNIVAVFGYDQCPSCKRRELLFFTDEQYSFQDAESGMVQGGCACMSCGFSNACSEFRENLP